MLVGLLSGWLPGGMDAQAWEAVIPSMGVMALVRCPRNFDQAANSDLAVEAVIAKITDRIYTFNLAGHRPSALPAGEQGRYTLGGFTDATFTAMAVLEGGRNASWPF
jgi:hypothetical protein